MLLSQLSSAETDPTLINGKKIDKSLFPDVVKIASGMSSCSASVVGKRVVLTAAHCIVKEEARISFSTAGKFYRGVCRQHPMYVKKKMQMDIALCEIEKDINISRYSYVAAENDFPELEDDVILIGYGCLRKDPPRGGNDGILRIGSAKVSKLPTDTYSWFDTLKKSSSDSSLCFGDSGGPSYKMISDYKNEKHYVYGVNSRGDIKRLSMLQAFVPEVYDFMESWQAEKGLDICGYNKDECLGESDDDSDDDSDDNDKQCERLQKKMVYYREMFEKYQSEYDKCAIKFFCYKTKKKLERYRSKYDHYKNEYERCSS